MPTTIYCRTAEIVARVPKVSAELNVTGVQTRLTHRQIFVTKQKSMIGKCNKKMFIACMQYAYRHN